MGTVWTEPEKYLTEIHQALGCHSAYMVEEIERLKDREDELGQQVTTLERDKSQLRADLDAAQRERDEARAQLREIDELIDPLDGQTLLEAVSYLIHDDGEPLTPRRCVTCAQEAAREMRDNAESICRDWNRAPYLAGSHFGGDSIPFVMRFHLADAIAALPLPSCADCNPLEPEAENEATR